MDKTIFQSNVLYLQPKGDKIMNEVIAHIDISTPAGRKIARELHGKKSVILENSDKPAVHGNLYDVDDVFDELLGKLKKHYSE